MDKGHGGHTRIIDAYFADYFGSIPHAELFQSVVFRGVRPDFETGLPGLYKVRTSIMEMRANAITYKRRGSTPRNKYPYHGATIARACGGGEGYICRLGEHRAAEASARKDGTAGDRCGLRGSGDAAVAAATGRR